MRVFLNYRITHLDLERHKKIALLTLLVFLALC
jgi:hypothetical protein